MGLIECMDLLFHHSQLHFCSLGPHSTSHLCQEDLALAGPDIQWDDSYEAGRT